MNEANEMLEDIKPVLDLYQKTGVVGIVLYGGWGRGEQLPYSDVDVAIVCESKRAMAKLQDEYDDNWQIKDYFVEPIYYDYEHLNSQPLPERMMRDYGYFWTEDTRFNWQQSKILYDPSGQTQQLIKGKAYLPEAEKQANLKVLIWVIGRSLNYHLPRFIDAKKYAEAQMLMNRLIGHIIHHVYNSSGLLMPHESAAFYWFNKKELPGKESIQDLLNSSEANRESCEKRINSIWRVCKELQIKIERQSAGDFLESFFEANGTKKWIDRDKKVS